MIYFIIGWYVIGVVSYVWFCKLVKDKATIGDLLIAMFVVWIPMPITFICCITTCLMLKGSKLQKFMDKELF